MDSDIDIVLKLKADQILHPPSDGNSDIDSALLKENSKSSPVLGGSKRYLFNINLKSISN